MKQMIGVLLLAAMFMACSSKKKEIKDTSNYFPFLSYLQSQVKHIDTSFYRITRIESSAGGRDSLIISREDFRKYAKEFLDLPDIKDPEVGSDYSETSIYDSMMNMVVLTYLANDNDLDVTRMEVRVTPTFSGNDVVESIYIEKEISKGREFIEKKMVWEVGKSFSIRTITQEKNEPEKVHDLKIIWQDFLNS